MPTSLMPSVDIINPAVQTADVPPPDEPGPINTVVGIIYPPPEVRSILLLNQQVLFNHSGIFY